MAEKITRIAIVGGGTAGWMTAATLSRYLHADTLSIQLIESEEISMVGVGEATVPIIQNFNRMLGINEWDFLRETKGTFKLGIAFKDWGKKGNLFFHGFGDFGADINGIAPHHHWLRMQVLGDHAPLAHSSFVTTAALANRFAPPSQAPENLLSTYSYAYHFDASLYAAFLRRYSEERGAQRIEGQIIKVNRSADSGFIEKLILKSGAEINADFYIDCSGLNALLIGESLGVPCEDWSAWLPCDTAIVAPCAMKGELTPYTLSTAKEAGWQWHIPLQHRTGNGYVYASGFVSDVVAETSFNAALESPALSAPRWLKFKAGHRKNFWEKNCLAIGLAAGYMEPLESTSIQLIQTGLARFISFFPDKNFDKRIISEYNRTTRLEYERIRDFIVLHYCFSERDGELWRYCRSMSLPDTLQHKIDVFLSSGKIPMLAEESYAEYSWVSIFLGLGVQPERYDPLAEMIDSQKLIFAVSNFRKHIKHVVQSMPSHREYVKKVCAMGS